MPDPYGLPDDRSEIQRWYDKHGEALEAVLCALGILQAFRLPELERTGLDLFDRSEPSQERDWLKRDLFAVRAAMPLWHMAHPELDTRSAATSPSSGEKATCEELSLEGLKSREPEKTP